jgi:hypothetical protein
MSKRSLALVLAGSAILTASCDSSDGATGSGGGTGQTEDMLTLTTPEFDVPVGDSFECFYLDVTTDKQLSVDRAVGSQAKGGHHITVYYADEAKDPQHHACDDAEMANWHQIVGASASGEPVAPLPDGVAFKVPAGKQLVLQAHYINNTSATMTGVRDSISIHLVKPEDVVEYANLWALYDGTFEIPAHAESESVSECTIDQDLDAIAYFGHEHELGKHFKWERLDDAGAVAEVLYDTDWKPSYSSHPPTYAFTLDDKLHFAKGTRIRQTCTWDNTTDDVVKFPREMCVGLIYYVPDAGMKVCSGQKPAP